jgi:Family of unknown function (DUF6387)
MAVIAKKSPALPVWFDLKKYSGARKLDAIEWYNNVVIRLELLHLASDEYRQHSKLWEETQKADFDKTFALLQQTPLFGANLPACAENLLTLVPLVRHSADEDHQIGVRTMTVRRAHLFLGSVSDQKVKHALGLAQMLGCWQVNGMHYKERSREARKHMRVAYPFLEKTLREACNFYPLSSHAVVIDLTLPDSQILKSMELYLKSFRQELGGTEGATKNRIAAFSSWANCSLLPFLDLAIWTTHNRQTLTRQQIATAIYPPHGSYDVQTLDKVTRPLVKELVASRSMFASDSPRMTGKKIDKLAALYFEACRLHKKR